MAGRGRPAFKPTAAQRRKVAELVACGMIQDDIARVLGISQPTLAKHFEEELTTGGAKKRAEVLAMLFKSAKAGNVTAQKKLEEMTRIAGAEAAFERAEKPATKAPKPGKKEAAAINAETAGRGTDWGDDLQPPPPGRLN